jgi:hypothetical protein
MVGFTIPYSPFEHAVTCPKLNSMQYQYGVGSNIITGVPPEFEDLLTLTQQPKWRNFERNSYKMALKIAPAEKFLLNVQPELRQAIGEKSCTNSTLCTRSIYRTKERFLPFVR